MTPCPSDDVLGAHVERALDAGESSRVADHLDDCEACRMAVIVAIREARTTPALAQGTPSLPFTPRPARSLVGTRMGRYELRALLGAGGMGQVFRAYDAELDREIAVKVLHPELARGAAVLADRLVRESRLMAKVVHPSVITVYDVGRTDDDAVFIAMELVRGETLGAYLARTKPSWREIVALFERAGAGLVAAHAAGIVHRDFKPDNVLVEGDARKVVVTDFGIAMDSLHAESAKPELAHGTDRIAKLTATGAAIGTPAYMAPEQLDAGTIDARADVFAFSVSLWEALFGERPFRGANVAELRAAMKLRPRATRSVPARIVRALERGLAIDPAARWPALSPMLAELAAARGRRTIVLASAGGAALVGGAIAATLLLSSSEQADPCVVPPLPSSAGLALDAKVIAELDTRIAEWRTTHATTCFASNDPPQNPATASCLDARRNEIEAFVEEAHRSGTRATELVKLVTVPTRCADARAGMLVSRMPADAATRVIVAEMRYRAFAIEQMRDRAEFTRAIAAAEVLVRDSANTWPIQRAEAMYLRATTLSIGGDKAGNKALQEAAAYAERVHHDYIAATSWLQLVQSTTFDEGDAVRALEYAEYADASLERIGRPDFMESMYGYNKALALVEAGRAAEAEPLIRMAVATAEKGEAKELTQSLLGLGHVLEGLGRSAEATDAFRRALELTPPEDPALHSFHERLGMNLAFLGNSTEAEFHARKSVELVDARYGEDSFDRAVSHSTLAQVLMKDAKFADALAEIRIATRMLKAQLGERHVRYGEILAVEGAILVDLHRYAEADRTLARACEILAFGKGEDAAVRADCLLMRANAVGSQGNNKDGEALVGEALAIFERTEVDGARIGNAYLQRAEYRDIRGKTDDAIADLERAIEVFTPEQLDPGHVAAAKISLAELVWAKGDKPRARKLAAEAAVGFATAANSWSGFKAATAEWIAKHP